jgi:hypothetical protein
VNPKVNEIILGPNKMEEVIEKKPKPNKGNTCFQK